MPAVTPMEGPFGILSTWPRPSNHCVCRVSHIRSFLESLPSSVARVNSLRKTTKYLNACARRRFIIGDVDSQQHTGESWSRVAFRVIIFFSLAKGRDSTLSNKALWSALITLIERDNFDDNWWRVHCTYLQMNSCWFTPDCPLTLPRYSPRSHGWKAQSKHEIIWRMRQTFQNHG